MIRVSGPGATRSGAGNDYEVLSLATCKEFLQMGGTEDDVLLQKLLDAVHVGAFEVTRGRIFKTSATPHVYLLDGKGTGRLRLPQWPVISLTSFSYGEVTDSTFSWTASTTFGTADYYVDTDNGVIVGLQGRVWTRGSNNHWVEFTAGYSSAQVPGRLLVSLAEWVGVLLKRSAKKTWDVLSESFNQEAKTYVLSSIPKATEDYLRSLRREVALIG